MRDRDKAVTRGPRHSLDEMRVLDGKLVPDRRDYWLNYYDANKEKIRARQNAYIRERRRKEAQAAKNGEAGDPVKRPA